MGINNKGMLHAINRIKSDPPRTIICASIAKNSSSASEADIVNDYKKAFSYLYDFVDMFTINVSCPNVEGLQHLQDVSYLSDPVDPLLDLRVCYDTYKPLLVKVSPDIPHEELDKRIIYRSEKDQRYYLMKEIEKGGVMDPKPNNNWRFVPAEWTEPAIARDRKLLFGE
jgi:dihydroorotate dehydrogenase